VGKLSSLALGIITAVGGFVDMGELVTCSQAGSQYRFALLWTITVGVLGIMVFIETAGRVAITSGRSIFDVIRERLGYRVGLLALCVAMVINILTIVIEVSGMALVIQLMTHLSYLWWVPAAAILVLVVLWFGSFSVVENGAAFLGLALLVFIVAAVKLAPPWDQVARQMVIPTIPAGKSLFPYAFQAVALLGAFMTPYEVFFYSSGAIEEKWTGSDFITNRVTTLVGFAFGSLIVISMMVVAAQTFFAHHLQSQLFSSIPVPIVTSLGTVGFLVFLLGAFASTGGAAMESTLSTTYTGAQFFGWDWGQDHTPKNAPIFSFTTIIALAIAVVIAFTGIDPVQLTIYTTALAAFSLPFTFIPLFIIANDEEYMGDMRNGRLTNIASIFFLAVLCLVTLATIPLFILSGGGGG
jgi:manganese transport protein